MSPLPRFGLIAGAVAIIAALALVLLVAGREGGGDHGSLVQSGPTSPLPSPTSTQPVPTATTAPELSATPAAPVSTPKPPPTDGAPPLPAPTTAPAATPYPARVTLSGAYSGFFDFPGRFFQESIVAAEQVVKVTDAQYLSLKKLHNGIAPYAFCRIEYDASHYGSTTAAGIKLGDAALPGQNGGHPRWEVMAHEQGHNFFGGTSRFYLSVAVPGPLIQESLAVLSAFYTFHDIMANRQGYGVSDAAIASLQYDFANGRAYQEGRYQAYVSQGKVFDANDVLTSQALDFKMILYGEQYGWQSFLRLARAFENPLGDQFGFKNDGSTPLEQSTYVVAALSAAFGRDLRTDFADLNFPIDAALYAEVLAKLTSYLN